VWGQHDRDVNARKNLVNWYHSTVAATGIHACGDGVRPELVLAPVGEAGKVAKQDLASPLMKERVS